MALTENEAQVVDDRQQRAGAETGPQLRDALNAPNLITLSRLLLAFVLFALIDANGFWLTAAVLFVVAASTDFLDGYIARRYGMVTVIGRILDPFVDKIIICGAFIFLLEKKVAVEHGGQVWSGVNAWMVLIIIGREMFVSSLRGFLEKQGKDFSANWTGKTKMILQCIAVTASLLSLAPDFRNPATFSLAREFTIVRDLLLWTAVIFTAYSGLAYVVRAVALLRSDTKELKP